MLILWEGEEEIGEEKEVEEGRWGKEEKKSEVERERRGRGRRMRRGGGIEEV